MVIGHMVPDIAEWQRREPRRMSGIAEESQSRLVQDRDEHRCH
jgi:hypothetical protein